jgi:hypothetical protein
MYYILNEYISCNEQDLVGMQWIHWSNEQGLVNYIHTHIL